MQQGVNPAQMACGLRLQHESNRTIQLHCRRDSHLIRAIDGVGHSHVILWYLPRGEGIRAYLSTAERNACEGVAQCGGIGVGGRGKGGVGEIVGVNESGEICQMSKLFKDTQRYLTLVM